MTTGETLKNGQTPKNGQTLTSVAQPTTIYETFASLGYGAAYHEGDELVVELPVAPHVVNTRGGIQGGLLAAMVDIVAGQHVVEKLASNTAAVTSDMNIRFLRPISEGAARARSRIIHTGRRSTIVQVDIYGTTSDKPAVLATVNFTNVVVHQ